MTETSKYSMDGANLKVEFLLAVYRRNTGNVNPQLTVTSDRTIIYRRAEEFGARAYNPGVGIENPSLIKKVEPEYTDDAKRAKIQGEVELEVVVLPNGSVGDIRVIRSLDRTYGLDEKAIEAARQWAFKPGKRDGRPLPVIVRLILSFRLH